MIPHRWGLGRISSTPGPGLATVIAAGPAQTLDMEPVHLAVIVSTSQRDLVWIGMAGIGLVVLGVESMTGSTSFDLLGVLYAALAGIVFGNTNLV